MFQMTPREQLVAVGCKNPTAVPGVEDVYLTDDDELWSYRRGRMHQLHSRTGRYNVGGITATVEKVRWCIEHDTPLHYLSEAKVAVCRHEGRLRLMDRGDYIREQLRRGRRSQFYANSEEFIKTVEEWCHYVTALYGGDPQALTQLWAIMSRLRPHLDTYMRSTLMCYSEARRKWVIDEVAAETIYRVTNRLTPVFEPYSYMRKMCRLVLIELKKIHGTACIEDDNIRIIGSWNRETKKQIYKI